MNKLLPEFFRRQDERPDHYFYKEPRCVTHLDEAASNEAKKLYDDLLPSGGKLLDLMASRCSHVQDKFDHVIGLGLNKVELEENELLDEHVVYDLNRSAELPFDDEYFKSAICTVSVQYMTRPLDTFAEVARTLKAGAPFVVTFSNRMFPSKAVLVWRSSDDAAHIRLVKNYFEQTPAFGCTHSQHYQPESGDPLYAVWAFKK